MNTYIVHFEARCITVMADSGHQAMALALAEHPWYSKDPLGKLLCVYQSWD